MRRKIAQMRANDFFEVKRLGDAVVTLPRSEAFDLVLYGQEHDRYATAIVAQLCERQ